MRFTTCLCASLLCYSSISQSANPDISLTLDGRYGDYSNTSDYQLPGFMLGEEAGRAEKNFYSGHNELAISSNIDDLFYGKFTVAITEHDGETHVELEEAYIQTLGLDYGLKVTAGRFFSDLGYLNNHHIHNWDFADAPLVYQALFANQLLDDGVQLQWLAPSELYIKAGLEITRGGRFPAGNEDESGYTRAFTVETGADLNPSHSWQLGLSHWRANIQGREAQSQDGSVDTAIFTGDSTINAIDLVWKWAPQGNSKETNLKVQFEYFQRKENGTVDLEPAATSSSYDGSQSGWYLQGVYQFMPRWRVGLRHDSLDSSNSGSDNAVLTTAGLSNPSSQPSRNSLMLDYSRSEFSRVRAQVIQDKSYQDSDTIILMQYLMSMGAHGAHSF